MTTNEDKSEVPPKKIRSHRDLIVWQKGIALAVETSQLARALPASERFALKDQMVRAAISIPSNVAEGQGQMAKGAYVRHLAIARGSLHELETLMELARQIGYFDDTVLEKAKLLADEVGRMLWVLMERLGARRLN